MRHQVLEAARLLERWGDAREWRGTDQYDALNATRLPSVLRGSAAGRRLVIQAVKRSPFDLRPLLGVPPGRNPVSLAWAASAYALGGFLASAAEEEAKLVRTIDMLDELRCRGYREPCWGYHFDFQSRVLFYAKSEPNVIATVYAGLALLDAFDRIGDPRLLERAHATGRFLVGRVPQTSDAPGAYFGYLIGDRSPIHNSNLHVCALLSRLYGATGDEALAGAARAGVAWTVARQRPDGSWPYGERPSLQWVDNFHTGYVLDALETCLEAGVLDDAEPLERGIEFYRTHMFLDDGTPKYFAHKTYPIDMWSVAQAIQSLSIASRRQPELLTQVKDVFAFALRRMRRRDGLFFFQRRALWTNRAVHVRGVIAPMLLALAHLLAALDRQDSAGEHRAAAELPSRR